MGFSFSFTSFFFGLTFSPNSSFNSRRNTARSKLHKTPPAPTVVTDRNIHGYLSKRDVKLSTVLSTSYETFRARFARQDNGKVPEQAEVTRKVVAPQTAACLSPGLNVVSAIHTVIETPPCSLQQPTSFEHTASRGDGERQVFERTYANNDDAPEEHIEVSAACDVASSFSTLAARPGEANSLPEPTGTLAPIKPLMGGNCNDDENTAVVLSAGNELMEREKAVSPSGANSDGEVEDGKSSTTKSHHSASTTLTSRCSNSEELTRADWEPLRALDHSKFQEILWQHLGGSDKHLEYDYHFCGAFEGSYNYVRIYDVSNSPNDGKYVIKIPCVGTAARWQKQDAYMLRSEFGTMKLVGERTKCPVPKVIACDDTLDNKLGAPYSVMKACRGVRAVEVWHDADANNHWDPDEVDFPSAELSLERSRMLRSLAQAMAELRSLEFDRIGALDFNNVDTDGKPAIGPLWEWNSDPELTMEDLMTEKALKQKPAYDSSLELFMDGLLEAWPYEGHKGRLMVMHQILDALFRSDALAQSVRPGDSKETFVLRHDDLNLQNVFCDPDTGEVTGIIDWERASTAPRCLGFSSLPIFLIHDWMPGYDLYDASHSPLLLHAYRKIYADAMIEATGADGDGRYTFKSAMYQAAHAALFGSSLGGDISGFVRQLLHEIPGLHHTDLELYLTWLGEHWGAVGSSVKEAIREVAKPVV
jgi:hypothetical protein